MMQSSHGWPGFHFLLRLIDVIVRHHEDTGRWGRIPERNEKHAGNELHTPARWWYDPCFQV